MQPNRSHTSLNGDPQHFDIIVVGGGFGGCYALWKFRNLGFSVHLFEAGSALGGVWHWNSYPGARVDSEMPYYQYSIPEVWKNWNWSQRFPGHEELKAYFKHVDNVLDLSKDIDYQTIVTGADFDQATGLWTITTSTGETVTCRYFVPATGSSYKKYEPKFSNMDQYKGVVVHAASWPEKGIDFKGKRVAIIGAGATGLQLVQEISKVADHTSVYIRNPNIALPMVQRDITSLESHTQKSIYGGLFRLARETVTGLGCDTLSLPASHFSSEEQQTLWGELWTRGSFTFLGGNYSDMMTDQETNRKIYEFWAKKVRERVRDPVKQEIIAPTEPPYPIATKRSSLEQDYYECLDRDDVEIVNLKAAPIQEFSATGIITTDGKERSHDFVILATGYDSMTGSLTSMGLRGKDGVDMKEMEGWGLYLLGDICSSYRVNQRPVFIESQVDFISEILIRMREEKIRTIEPTDSSEEYWKRVCRAGVDDSIFRLNESSWYFGANIPGKKREPLNYVRGIVKYAEECKDGLKDWSNFDIRY